MRKMLTFALLGGAVGAGVAVVKTTGPDESPMEADESGTMKAVGGAALAGAVLGLMLDRRTRRRAKQLTRGAKMAAGVAGVAKAARPKFEHAIEVGLPKLEMAAGITRDAAVGAAEAARTRLHQAA
jgi:hypothetical protein